MAKVETKIEPSLIARAMAGVRYVATGKAPDWFGPGEPMKEVAPESVAGRQFNFPVTVNTNTSTKTDGFSFQQLRNFADACDIVRVLIETRKDQICGLDWIIKPVEGAEPLPLGQKAKPDPRIAALTAFFKSPDKQRSWSEWLRLLLEDLFVLDAPTLYVQRTFGGELYALRPIDGGTIKRIIDSRGWEPLAPAPAYQQILRGMPAIDYTADELIYKPRNPRAHRIYGYSPIEQIVVTMQLLLSRQASNLEFYTSGNLPEGFLQGGEGWTPEQIAVYQENMDLQLSGNFAERRKARVVPAKSQYQAVKEPALKSDYDEWLARIACFAFSYPPSAFIKEMNRATSESAKRAADEEGENPLRHWVKELIDGIIQQRMGYADLQFSFHDKEAQDPMERAQIDQIYITAGVIHPDEVRADLGKAPLTPEQKADLAPPPPVIPGDNATTADAKAGKPAKDGAAKPGVKKSVSNDDGRGGADTGPFEYEPVDLDRPAAVKARNKLAEEIAAVLQLASDDAATQITVAIAAGETDVDVIIAQVTMDALSAVEGDLIAALTETAVDAGTAADTMLGVEVTTDLINERAVDWAKARAADLIGKDASGGELLDATRNLIRGAVEQALADGIGSKQLAKILREEFAFSAQRAETIARTEIAAASVNGSLHSWIASGVVVRKRWLLAAHACVICQANADQGEIALLTLFQSGDMGPPGHPNCRCSLRPVTG